MASAITLTGIDQAISNLKYANKNTLKYRLVHNIRQYYVNDNSLESLKEISHTELIKRLWDTEDHLEVIKNKRKNMSSLRSSVNADLKKLYEKGENPEGIKIGTNNIFVMSEDAKDNILNQFGYDLQPDGKLKLDQIMDILKLANESVSDSMAVEDTKKKENLSKIEQLKDLIKGLSEKVGLGAPGFSKAGAGSEGQQAESQCSQEETNDVSNIEIVDEDEVLLGIEDIGEEKVSEEIADIKEDEILDVIEEVDEDEILDDVEDSDSEIFVDEETVDEDLEEAADEEDAELEYVDIVEEDSFCDNVTEQAAGESGAAGKEEAIDQLGLPIDSLGQEYRSEKDSRLKKDKLLSEEFDGYLGTMDRYYNHYILIDGGEYLIGSKHPENSSLYSKVVKGDCWYRQSGPDSTLHNKRNHPVVQISLEDAMAFAAWTGKRLPTENEWEAASRTANGWMYPWGQEWKINACNIEDSCIAETTPVDKYAEFENNFGIIDVLGNVLEWTSDDLGTMSQDNNDTIYRIAKGGSWVSGNDIRLCSRFKIEAYSHSNILGFRCVAF
ncbi:MAG: SUMF1/EgtB/PvdO family nonheme iron enzyme [Desulfobacterales bacterium]